MGPQSNLRVYFSPILDAAGILTDAAPQLKVHLFPPRDALCKDICLKVEILLRWRSHNVYCLKTGKPYRCHPAQHNAQKYTDCPSGSPTQKI